MAELKTKKNKVSVSKFIAGIEDEQKRKDSKELVKIFKEVTKKQPTVWGDSIIGFGQYHYESERSSQKGDWPLTGFSPRKQQITIYIMYGPNNYPDLLEKLGKFKASKGSCVYVKKLDDIHIPTLKKLIRKSVADMKKRHKA